MRFFLHWWIVTLWCLLILISAGISLLVNGL
jgi:hypothetical protein